VVAGRQSVRELLRAGRRRVRDVWMADGLAPSEIVDEIGELAQRAGVPVRRVAREHLEADAGSDSPQGVLAHAEPLAEVALADLTVRRPGEPQPFLLLLDGVTDPHNLGAVLRSAACAGVTGVVVPRHRSALVTPTVTKAAAGAIEYLPLAVVPGIGQALLALAERGVWTVGLEASAPLSVFDLQVATEPLALVLGGEGAGLARLTRQRCDVLAAIPQTGQTATAIGSLNVAAAAAVACFAVARTRG
jgi:23S rRNA (guanosine2251-2'-O)-methyltransferase